MYYCDGRFSRLVELNSKNNISLFFLLKENAEEYQRLVSDKDLPISYPEFLETLKTWFSKGRMYQFLVYPKHGNKPVGTIFFFNLNQQDESIKISVFFEKKVRGKLVVAESIMMTLAFIRQIIGVKNILFSVYDENETMRKIAKKIVYSYEYTTHSSVNKKRTVKVYKISHVALDNILIKLQKLHQ